MEISLQAIAFWVLYQVLGLQGFRYDDIYHDRSLDELQIKTIGLPGWNVLSHNPREEVNNINREKRFFEFNPVAFNQKPKNKLVDEERRKQFLLSPFISSLERLQTFSEQENAPRFKSAYITKGKTPKDLNPFLDHFSGVKSFALHFKHPDRLGNIDTTANDESMTDKLRPLSGISMRAVFDPSTYQLSQKDTQHFNDEQSIHAKHSTWRDVPKYDRKNKLQALIDNSLYLNLFGVERPGYDQYSSKNKGDLIFNDLYHKSTKMRPELFDVIQNDGTLTSQNIQSTKTEKGNSKVGKNKVPKNYQVKENLFDAIPGLVETINEDNELTSKEKFTIIPTESSTISPMENVAYTSGSSKDKFDHLMSNIGQNFKTDPKPHFGFDLGSSGSFQTLGNDFKSFESNTNGNGPWETGNTQSVDSQLPNDFGFGSFDDIIEHKDTKQDQIALGGFGSFKESGSTPSFDNDEMAQTFDNNFKSFEFKTNGNGPWEIGNTQSVDSQPQNDFGLGNFGDIIEHKDNKQDQTAFGGYGSFKESGSTPSFDNDDMAQIFDNDFKSFEYNTNGNKPWETGNTPSVDSQLANDFGFGSFGDIIEHKDTKQDQTGGFGSFKESGSIPPFDKDHMAHDEFHVFEQGFGSFSTDNKDCEIIDTKSCEDDNECSCYGLYQCKQGKCLSTQAFISEEALEEPDFGQWHAEPVQFDSWS